jgi:hypothetical protein
MLGDDAPHRRLPRQDQGGTVTIGDVFAGAWSLWRRDVGWLILAGLVVGVIMAVIFGIAFGIFTAIFAGAGLSLGVDAANDTTSSLSGLGAGLLVVGFIAYTIVMFCIEVLAMTFYGGMFEMVIGSYRDKRPVSFGDLFSGFRKLGSYAVFALVMLGISLGLNLLGLLPFLGAIIAFVVSVWLSVIWMYVLPLIADQGLSFSAAAGRSHQMVKAAGWWWTFGMVVLLGLAALAAVVVILIVARALYGGSEGAGIVLGLLLFLLLAVLFPPYAICYVSVLYVASGGDVVPATAGGLPGIPPAPPAPPTYGMPAEPTYGAPTPTPYGAPSAASQAPGVYGGAAPAPYRGGDDAWKAAADPLASQAPPPLASPASRPAAAEQTAVTDVGAPEAPEAPEPPAPPDQQI